MELIEKDGVLYSIFMPINPKSALIGKAEVEKMTYNDAAKKNGTVTMDGLTVVLTQQAYVCNYGTAGEVQYKASAIDTSGNIYIVTWATTDGWADHKCGSDGNCVVAGCGGWCEDEGNACDWDNPLSIQAD